VSYDDFCVIRDNLNGRSRSTRNRLIPFCIFTDPELARVGLNESEARAKNIDYRVARLPATGVFRTLTLSESRAHPTLAEAFSDSPMLEGIEVGESGSVERELIPVS